MSRSPLAVLLLAWASACAAEGLHEPTSDGRTPPVDDPPPEPHPPLRPEEECGGTCASRQFAQWPMTHPAGSPGPFPFAFRADGDWVVDDVTEIAWTAEAVGPLTFREAQVHCARLASESDSEVRLPTRIEVVSLLDRSRRPTLAASPFGVTPPDYFWTDTPYPGDEELAFSVYFGLGETATGRRSQRSAFVRCARGGRQVGLERLRRDDEELLDWGTRLVWEVSISSVPLPLSAAELYCSQRRRQGSGAPWRLPSEKELQTLVDPSRSRPAVVAELAEETPSAPFWAQSPPQADPLTVDFATGLAQHSEPDEDHFVRCVAWAPHEGSSADASTPPPDEG